MCRQCIIDAQRHWPTLPDTASADDITARILPGIPSDYRGYLLWNETAYPLNHFGGPDGWGRQLRNWRNKNKRHLRKVARKEAQHGTR